MDLTFSVNLARVPCSSSVCLVTRKLSAPERERKKKYKRSDKSSGKPKCVFVVVVVVFLHWFILFWIQFHHPRIHLLRARSATSRVTTRSFFMLTVVICEERKQNYIFFRAYLFLSTRVRRCHTSPAPSHGVIDLFEQSALIFLLLYHEDKSNSWLLVPLRMQHMSENSLNSP